MFIPQLGKYAESILENGNSSGRKLAKLQAIGRQAVAALCALGGFKETIKIGSEVQVTHEYWIELCFDLIHRCFLFINIICVAGGWYRCVGQCRCCDIYQ